MTIIGLLALVFMMPSTGRQLTSGAEKKKSLPKALGSGEMWQSVSVAEERRRALKSGDTKFGNGSLLNNKKINGK